MELDNKLATSGSRDTVTSLYRRHEAKFLDHSSLDIEEDDTRINFSTFSKSVDPLGLASSDIICESVEERSRGRGHEERWSVDRQVRSLIVLEDNEERLV